MLFAISTNEDGESYLEKIEDFQKWVADRPNVQFLDWPQNGPFVDLNSGKLGRGYLLIKGEVVVPQPKQVVETFEEP